MYIVRYSLYVDTEWPQLVGKLFILIKQDYAYIID